MRLREFGRRLSWLFRKDRLVQDLDEEMRLHLDLRARKLGNRQAAERQFGNRASLQEASVELWGWVSLERLADDIRYSLRALRKTPAFTIVAILTLALGLGMNTAVFSVVHAVMLRSLPYRDPHRLLALWEDSGSGRLPVAPANLADYRQRTGSFEDLAAYSLDTVVLTGNDTPERILTEAVTFNYWKVLGVTPLLGRDFLPEEDRPGAPHVVVVSHRFWQRHLGMDTAALGRTLTLDGRAFRVVGVLPPQFESPARFLVPDPIELYVPAAFPPDILANRNDHEVGVVARLRPGISVRNAQADLDRLTLGTGTRAVIAPLQSDLVRNVRDSLLALLGASGLIVLITCVNVANLLLVRAVARRHETSVRFALGAARLRIVRQFLMESLLVAIAGCAAGLLLGAAMMRLLVRLAPANIPRLSEVAMDWPVFLAATLIATVTGVAFGIAPAWQASRIRPVESMKSSTRNSAGLSQARWRMTLTVTEVALSMILLIGAGLMLKSFVRLSGVDLGLRPERVLSITTNLPPNRYRTQEQRLRFFQQLEDRVRALPGVESVAFANKLPLRAGGWSSGFQLDTAPGSMQSCDFQAVNPGYFETLAIRPSQGRAFTFADRSGTVPVAVVNQTFARRFLPNGDPLAVRLRRGPNMPWVAIVGVVNDVRRGGKSAQMTPQVYLSANQTPLYPVRLADMGIRTAGDPHTLANAIQHEVWAIDKDQTVTNIKTLEEIVDASVAERRFQMLLLAAFAAVAVALALIGMYGVLAYIVGRRTNEFGVRIALGAAPRSILAMVLRQAGTLIGAGMALGLSGAFLLTRYLESLLFQVHRHDWPTYAAAALLLAAAALAASLIPARRGSKVDPMIALRYE